MEYIKLYFKHGMRDIIPYSDFIKQARSQILPQVQAKYLGDDMAIDGGDAEGVFSCSDAKKLFELLEPEMRKLQFLQGAKVTIVLGEVDEGSPEEVIIL